MAGAGVRTQIVCFACFRAERDRTRTQAPAVEAEHGAHADASRRLLNALTPRQRAHRFRMLIHLRRTGSR